MCQSSPKFGPKFWPYFVMLWKVLAFVEQTLGTALNGNKIKTTEPNTFFGLYSLSSLNISGQNYTNLTSMSFNGLNYLNELILSDNQIKLLLNNTFLNLKQLETLYLDGNQIESIEIDSFNGLTSLKNLSLNRNKLKQLTTNQNSIFYNLNKLMILELESNLLTSLNRSDFKGLINLSRLNLKSNSINFIESNAFEEIKENIYFIELSLPNITFDQKCDLKKTFQFNWTRKFAHIKYYRPVHIDNRVDNSCENIIEFFRVKILYNFFNEHIDSVSFFQNCDRLGKIGRIKFKECIPSNKSPLLVEEAIALSFITFFLIFYLTFIMIKIFYSFTCFF